jgi:hypothetical protein
MALAVLISKKSLIAIFYDTNVFSRLKTEARSFTALGIPSRSKLAGV